MKNTMSDIRTYNELSKLTTFDDRFKYLKLNGVVSEETFGFDRYLNQKFYTSPEWQTIRRKVIIRDEGNDMGLVGYPVDKIYIHHMNPIMATDIYERSDILLNPEYLVCVSFETHNAIHYGNLSYLDSKKLVERKPNDTCPWRC